MQQHSLLCNPTLYTHVKDLELALCINVGMTLQAEELLVSLVSLIKLVIEDGAGQVTEALQEAARHLHDQGILVSCFAVAAGKHFMQQTTLRKSQVIVNELARADC